MQRSRWIPPARTMAFCLSIIFVGCSSDVPDSEPVEPFALPDDRSSTTHTSSAVPNHAPVLRVAALARAEIGQVATEAVVASDPDGDIVTIRIGEGPVGFRPTTNDRGQVNGFEWEPTEPGEWLVMVAADDSSGLRSTTQVRLIARSPRSGDLMLAMGDSVAAGFGRHRSDYLGPDGCWRSEARSYPARAFETLIEAGSFAADAEFLMAACASSDTRSLEAREVSVTDAEGDHQGDGRTQLQWAEVLNPTVITLTVGSEDVGLANLETLLTAVGDQQTALDAPALTLRLDDLDTALSEVLERLVTRTDAHIALTTYYDPTASNPIGLSGCAGECFREFSALVRSAVNDRIRAIGTRLPDSRITIIRFDDAFSLRRAPNGLGPDALRAVDLDPFQPLLGRFSQGTMAYCGEGVGQRDTLVSSLDCTHPTAEGHEVLANLVTAALFDI